MIELLVYHGQNLRSTRHHDRVTCIMDKPKEARGHHKKVACLSWKNTKKEESVMIELHIYYEQTLRCRRTS